MALMARIHRVTLALTLLSTFVGTAAAQHVAPDIETVEDLNRLVRQTFAQDSDARLTAVRQLVARGEADVVPALIQTLRFISSDAETLVWALQQLTGDDAGPGWHDWMLWQEAHPEIVPHPGFTVMKADLMALIDPAFRVFLYEGVQHSIRIEEIVWGGVRKDGIPALVNPKHTAADEAYYLTDDELVFGVAINGDARAYPLRIMDWHEMFNDVVGGVPVALAYCTLCGSGILYDTRVAGRAEPFEFGSSGFLYRSNKLMYDQATHSLWNQFTGRPVVGELTESDIELKILPVAITSWAKWRARHPQTKVLSIETGYARDYTPGRPYGTYFDSPDLMFPALVPSDTLAAKDYVFALRDAGIHKAWSLALFEGGAVVNGTLAGREVVLIGDAASRTVRAYESDGRQFTRGDDPWTPTAQGESWRADEDALVGPTGARLPRLSGHIAYWFAFNNYLRDAEVVTAP